MTPPPPLMQMIHELIASPSISSVDPAQDLSNLAIIGLLEGWLSGMGFATEVMPVADGKANLIATLGRGDDALVLAGHTDTVPYDEHGWSHDPFRLTEHQHHISGLGSTDMKAFLALAIEAARHVRERDLRQPLVILATADEETSMSGAKALTRRDRPLGRYAVIGEPTSLRPIRMHKGMMMEGIRLVGRSGHSSDPALGNSALEAMHRVMGELLSWRSALQANHQHPGFAVPVPTLNLGHIHGGDNPNRICGECRLNLDLRPLPGMAVDELRSLLRNKVIKSLQNTDIEVHFETLFEGVEGLDTEPDSAIVKAVERLTGRHADSVAFGTEGPYLARMGTETVVLGPGDIAQAHRPNEGLALNTLQPTIDLLQALIERFCLSDNPA